MDDHLKELIAVGASAAVNCHPCLEFHLAACDRLGIDRALVAQAMEVGMQVNRGAAAKTRAHVATILEQAQDAGGPGGCGCG